MYLASARRQAVEALEARKLAMTTGFWANDGLNADSARSEALEDLDEQFQKAVDLVYSGNVISEEDEAAYFTEEDEKNPFLIPAIKATRGIQVPKDSPEFAEEETPDLMTLDQS